jgi:pimeloyl-ACP methyl ester carboxylesterase
MRVQEPFLADCLAATKEETEAVSALLNAGRSSSPCFWRSGVGEELFIPATKARIRVMHFRAHDLADKTAGGPDAVRPIVLIPGFGATPEGFQDFYEAVRSKGELYYFETREKPSSRILDSRADMSVAQSAADIAQALSFLGLNGSRDYVLVALCWGAAIVLEGIIRGIITAPTVLLADPMHTLWFPKWVLRFVSPLLPVPLVRAVRPMIARAMIGGMKEPAQKKRAMEFVNSADIWKWKKSAEAATDFELFGRLGAISSEVFVLNGTADRIHDPRNYPRMAREMPRGRFLHMPAEESNRERLFGVAALEFARVEGDDGLPPSLAQFEKQIR